MASPTQPAIRSRDSADEWDLEGEVFDGAATALQMQTFLDDWHYRVLHAGMATEYDRTEAVIAALNLFEAHGIVMSSQEKEQLATLEEDVMIDAVVGKMTPELRRNFEHFALQLQLIVSTATRVRGALEQEDVEIVRKIMEEGDAGITQHIMKRTVVEAGHEIGELKDVHDGWNKDMGSRLNRLSGLAEMAEKNRQELDKVNAEIAAFHGKQNEKAKKAVLGMSSQSNATLLKSAFGGWSHFHIRFKGERHLHEKFQAEILQAKTRLKEVQGSSVNGVKRALLCNVEQSNKVLLAECVRRWGEDIRHEKQLRREAMKFAHDVEHLETLQSSQKAAAKRSLMRMIGGNEESLIVMTFTSWAKHKEEVRKQRDFEERETKLQQQLADMKSKGKGGAKSVLQRVSESSGSGIIGNVFTAWRDDVRTEVRARSLEETINSQNAKFKSLNAKQKGNAKHAAQSAIELEEHNTLMNIFMNWAAEVEISRVILHYSGKMQGKKQQLDQVQSMFKDFASALEQGIGTTPRTEKKSGRSQSRVKNGDKKPPLPAAA